MPSEYIYFFSIHTRPGSSIAEPNEGLNMELCRLAYASGAAVALRQGNGDSLFPALETCGLGFLRFTTSRAHYLYFLFTLPGPDPSLRFL